MLQLDLMFEDKNLFEIEAISSKLDLQFLTEFNSFLETNAQKVKSLRFDILNNLNVGSINLKAVSILNEFLSDIEKLFNNLNISKMNDINSFRKKYFIF